MEISSLKKENPTHRNSDLGQWCKANSLAGLPTETMGHGGRILTDEFNRVKNQANIFAIGDICLITEKDYPMDIPRLRKSAIQQGKLLAKT